MWESISSTQTATSVGVHFVNSIGHTEAWQSILPTKQAIPKRGNPYLQLKGPHQNVKVPIPNPTGHPKVWGSRSSTQGATPKRKSPYLELKEPHRRMGVHILNSIGNT